MDSKIIAGTGSRKRLLGDNYSIPDISTLAYRGERTGYDYEIV